MSGYSLALAQFFFKRWAAANTSIPFEPPRPDYKGLLEALKLIGKSEEFEFSLKQAQEARLKAEDTAKTKKDPERQNEGEERNSNVPTHAKSLLEEGTQGPIEEDLVALQNTQATAHMAPPAPSMIPHDFRSVPTFATPHGQYASRTTSTPPPPSPLSPLFEPEEGPKVKMPTSTEIIRGRVVSGKPLDGRTQRLPASHKDNRSTEPNESPREQGQNSDLRLESVAEEDSDFTPEKDPKEAMKELLVKLHSEYKNDPLKILQKTVGTHRLSILPHLNAMVFTKHNKDLKYRCVRLLIGEYNENAFGVLSDRCGCKVWAYHKVHGKQNPNDAASLSLEVDTEHDTGTGPLIKGHVVKYEELLRGDLFDFEAAFKDLTGEEFKAVVKYYFLAAADKKLYGLEKQFIPINRTFVSHITHVCDKLLLLEPGEGAHGPQDKATISQLPRKKKNTVGGPGTAQPVKHVRFDSSDSSDYDEDEEERRSQEVERRKKISIADVVEGRGRVTTNSRSSAVDLTESNIIDEESDDGTEVVKTHKNKGKKPLRKQQWVVEESPEHEDGAPEEDTGSLPVLDAVQDDEQAMQEGEQGSSAKTNGSTARVLARNSNPTLQEDNDDSMPDNAFADDTPESPTSPRARRNLTARANALNRPLRSPSSKSPETLKRIEELEALHKTFSGRVQKKTAKITKHSAKIADYSADIQLLIEEQRGVEEQIKSLKADA